MNTLWLDLLNSDWHDYKGGGRDEDRLENRQWLRKFLNKWEALQIEPDYPSIIKELKALRTLIRKMADDFRSEKGIRKADLNSFNTILENSPMVSRIEGVSQRYSISRYSINPGQGSILADIASSFAEILVQGEPERVKICQNKDCFWIFYDQSKNRSRKWCEGGTGCGNLMKVRRFRDRQNNIEKKQHNKIL